jgi:hypothetical protein
MGPKLRPFLDDAKYGLRKRFGMDQDRKLFLDSGAFSFQNAAGCIAGRSNQDVTELNTYDLLRYSLDYIEFIKEFKHYFDIMVEVDVDYVIGVEKTKYLFDRLRDEGRDVRPVWHVPRGNEQWERECANFDYHGIEGFSRHKDDPVSFYNQMLKVSHEQQNYSKVHGFAFTSEQLLYQIPFDSVDSASWMLTAANGVVKTPYGSIAISSKQQTNVEIGDNLNYYNLKPQHKKVFDDYVKGLGFTPEKLATEWKDRAALNTYFYTWMEDEVNKHWGIDRSKKVYQKPIF